MANATIQGTRGGGIIGTQMPKMAGPDLRPKNQESKEGKEENRLEER